MPPKMITVTETFEAAAFDKYRQSVLKYGNRLWSEARSVAHQRNPDANVIEITTPDVEAATVRTEMKLTKLRQVRFPFRLVLQLLTIIEGFLLKAAYDLGNLATGSPAKSSFFGVSLAAVTVLILIFVVNYFDWRAEALR